jgi:hypothetical protein
VPFNWSSADRCWSANSIWHYIELKLRNLSLLCRSRTDLSIRPGWRNFITKWCPARKCYYYLNKLDTDFMKALDLDYNFTALRNVLSNTPTLGAFSQSRKALLSFTLFCLSVRLFAYTSATSAEQMSVKLDIGHFCENLSRKHKFCYDQTKFRALYIKT